MADAIAHPHVREERLSAGFVFGGAFAETIIGIGTVVLAIIGLSGFMQGTMLAVATIGVGASLLFEGGAVASRLSELVHDTTEGRLDVLELGGGLSAEFVAGLAGVTLGILSLVHVMPLFLSPIAVIVFGAALMIGAGVKNRLNMLTVGSEEHHVAKMIAREAILAANGVLILAGMGGVVLGILALLRIDPMILTLVGLLSISAAIMLSGTALGTKMLTVFRS